MEAAKFAAQWLPFCRDNNILVRSPEAYFNSTSNHHDHSHQKIKMMYNDMKERIEGCMKKGFVGEDMIISEKDRELFMKWKSFIRRDHPPVIKILLHSDKDKDISGVPLPNLVYLSREKSPKIPHNFKAGALNSLLRASGLITNAPVILTLDCDMYSNDPAAPLRPMCYFFDPNMASDLAYVQYPQHFRGINDKDIYAAEVKRLFQINSQGLDGLCGPNYVGTGCFFNRRCFFGSPSSSSLECAAVCDTKNDGISDSVLQEALDALNCRFEHGTKWGSSIGFQYESIVEDFNTGYRLHCRGWRSVLCEPERPAFIGDAPMSLNDALGQVKRWCVGLYELGFSRHCPLTFGVKNVSFPVGLCYAYNSFWGLWSIPITIYGLLPQLALMNHIPLFPKISDAWFYLYAYLFITAYAQDLIEFIRGGSTFGKWWNEQRMWMIRGLTSFFFGSIEFTLKSLGISTPGFTVTNKVMDDDEQNERYNKGLYEFGVTSPFFFPLAVVTIVNLSCFVLGVAEVLMKKVSFDEMFVQLFISGFVVLNSWPIYDAMFFRMDQGRMPIIVTVFGVCMTSVFVLLSFSLF